MVGYRLLHAPAPAGNGSIYGEPQFSGLEYDYEVADNNVIASPGGASAIHHHWTHGMYSPSVSSSDVYAGEGIAYPHGAYGNLYQDGKSAVFDIQELAPPPEQGYDRVHRDNFEAVDGTLELTTENEPIPEPPTRPAVRTVHIKNPYILFGLFLLVYVAFSLWGQALLQAVIAVFNGGKPLTWERGVCFAVIATATVAVVAGLVDVPLVTFESV